MHSRRGIDLTDWEIDFIRASLEYQRRIPFYANVKSFHIRAGHLPTLFDVCTRKAYRLGLHKNSTEEYNIDRVQEIIKESDPDVTYVIVEALYPRKMGVFYDTHPSEFIFHVHYHF